jgi:phage shock protein A
MGHEEMARAALGRSLSHRQIATGFAQQIEDQVGEAELMRLNYGKLQQKLRETEAQCQMLIARQRRVRTVNRTNRAVNKTQLNKLDRTMERMKLKVIEGEANNAAARLLEQDELMSNAVEENFRRLEREDRIEALLEELKSRKRLPSQQTEMKALNSE